MNFFKILIVFAISSFGLFVNANTLDIDASRLLSRVEVYLSPRSGSFVEGSTFDVPIILDTKGSSVNGIEVRINFDKNKLSIIKPSSGKSIIGVWVEPPKYDNNNGTASYVGVVPNGIITESGLIGTITFKALKTGTAVVSINSNTNILLNDGLGTKTLVGLGRSEYNLIPKSPEGVYIFSETHPQQSEWYNNKNPILSWDKEKGVDGFSFILDNKPSTIPDNTIDTNDSTISFQDLEDGIWYFHIKAIKQGVWGNTGHFLIKIDTAPPAEFTPDINYLITSGSLSDRVLVSFFTTDNLSGIDYYEVGVINKKDSVTVSPAFIQSESPFQIPIKKDDKLEVVVRSIDKAGNIRDISTNINKPFILIKFLNEYAFYILIFIVVFMIISFILHYLFGHHIIRNIIRLRNMIKKEEIKQDEIDKNINQTLQP